MALGFSAGQFLRVDQGLYRVDLSQGFSLGRFSTGLEKLCFEVLYFLFSEEGSVYNNPTLGTQLSSIVGNLTVGGDSGRVAALLADQIQRGESRILASQQGRDLPPEETLKRLVLDSVTTDVVTGSCEMRLAVVNSLDQAVGLDLPIG